MKLTHLSKLKINNYKRHVEHVNYVLVSIIIKFSNLIIIRSLPRMCSTPSSPGLRAIQTMECLTKEMVFKVPKVPSKKNQKLKVLDEETYIEVNLFIFYF